jgi:hypothetical protein
VFLKDAGFIRSYQNLLGSREVSTMLEIGSFHGAGLALFGMLLEPENHIGVDIVQEAPILEHHIEANHFRNVKPYYGVNQADKAALGAILEQEFPDRNLDLVIDDASHMYYPARPRLASLSLRG